MKFLETIFRYINNYAIILNKVTQMIKSNIGIAFVITNKKEVHMFLQLNFKIN